MKQRLKTEKNYDIISSDGFHCIVKKKGESSFCVSYQFHFGAGFKY